MTYMNKNYLRDRWYRRRRKQMECGELNYCGNLCPKAWNKIYHRRPVRRRWKRYCQKVTVPLEIYVYGWYEQPFPMSGARHRLEVTHISEGIPCPSHKRHIYYL